MVGCNYNVEETHEQRQPLEFLDWSKVQLVMCFWSLHKLPKET